MGQQQLLLIVLGVILVGVAVVLGIQYFSVGAEEGAKDEIVAHNLTIGANAQQFAKKPTAMGGGNNSFADFITDAWTNKLEDRLGESTNGQYLPSAAVAASILITGSPKAPLGYTWSVATTVYLDIMVTVINP